MPPLTRIIIAAVALLLILFVATRIVSCASSGANSNTSNSDSPAAVDDSQVDSQTSNESTGETAATSQLTTIDGIAVSTMAADNTYLIDAPSETGQQWVLDALATGDTFTYTSQVQELLQYPDLSAGCELVSLTCLLNAMGYDADMNEIADDYTEYGDGYVYTYSGSPYTDGMGYPPCIATTGNSYLIAQGSGQRLRNFSGATLDQLSGLVNRGIPVLIWTTMYLGWPMDGWIEEDGYVYYENEHCMVLYGLDDDYAYVMDPMLGITQYDRQWFEEIYDYFGQYAVSLAA